MSDREDEDYGRWLFDQLRDEPLTMAEAGWIAGYPRLVDPVVLWDWSESESSGRRT